MPPFDHGVGSVFRITITHRRSCFSTTRDWWIQPSTSHALNGAGVAQERRTVPVEDVEKASRAKLYCGEIRRAMSCPRLQRQSLYDRLGDVDCFAIVRWQIYMCTTPYAEHESHALASTDCPVCMYPYKRCDTIHSELSTS